MRSASARLRSRRWESYLETSERARSIRCKRLSFGRSARGIDRVDGDRRAVPYVDDDDRVAVEHVNERFVRVRATFGYMERPTLAPILRDCEREALDIDKESTSFVYANPEIVRAGQGGLARWQRSLFVWLQRNARTLATELEIPPSRRVELSVETPV